MITESQGTELFTEPKGSLGRKLLAGVCALVITALVLAGYSLLRRRHAQITALSAPSPQLAALERKGPPKALVLVDDAILRGGTTIIGGTVKNTSTERLEGLSVELELKRRKGAIAERKVIGVAPAHLDPQQEGRYSLELKGQEYGSARLVALKADPNSLPLAYSLAQGQKRPLERLESKTITLEKRSTKRDEFLNTPDKPARVP